MLYEKCGGGKPDDARSRRRLVVLGAVAAVVVLLMAAAVLLGDKPAYLEPLDMFVDICLSNADAETLVGILPPAVVEEMENRSNGREDMLESLEYGLKFARKYLEKELGTNLKAMYEIRRDKKLGQKKLKELEERYQDLLDVDLDIKEARELKYRVTFSGREDETSSTNTVVVLKVDDKWYWDFTTLGL